MFPYKVVVLKEGYSRGLDKYQAVADCTVTLLKGPHNILIDTGNPSNAQYLIDALSNHGLVPNDINYVICTHGHLDHVGNLNLFSKAITIVGKDICLGGDKFDMHDFESDRHYEVDEHVHVMYTPGHTCHDVSVLVKGTEAGNVVIAGDIFEREEDMEDPSVWMSLSRNHQEQETSRLKIMALADVIIPGHGPMFTLKPEFRRHISFEEMEDEMMAEAEAIMGDAITFLS